MSQVHVIGGGLAGCEAAALLARRGHQVTLFEQKPHKRPAAGSSDGFAELVCSNSFKAARVESAAGLLKAEMRLLGSICLQAAKSCEVPAGGALAVDREAFSAAVTEAMEQNPNIEIVRKEVTEIDGQTTTVVASGPLTEGGLAVSLAELCGAALAFYDAAAPIIMADSIDMRRVYAATRYGHGHADYLNCYFDKPGYEAFWQQLCEAERAKLHAADDFKVYEGCMPIEELARRGRDAMRFGPLKPVGLIHPETGHRPWAAVQLRKEDTEGRLYNLVGFQTNLTFGEQRRVLRTIPGLEHAEFARYGVMHRNTFIDAPRVLTSNLSVARFPHVFIAGQLTGFEGYMESAGCGLLAGIYAADRLENRESSMPGRCTMLGALLRYILTDNADFQPMGANMGILPPLDEQIRDKQLRYAAYAQRALCEMEDFANENRH